MGRKGGKGWRGWKKRKCLVECNPFSHPAVQPLLPLLPFVASECNMRSCAASQRCWSFSSRSQARF